MARSLETGDRVYESGVREILNPVQNSDAESCCSADQEIMRIMSWCNDDSHDLISDDLNIYKFLVCIWLQQPAESTGLVQTFTTLYHIHTSSCYWSSGFLCQESFGDLVWLVGKWVNEATTVNDSTSAQCASRTIFNGFPIAAKFNIRTAGHSHMIIPSYFSIHFVPPQTCSNASDVALDICQIRADNAIRNQGWSL